MIHKVKHNKTDADVVCGSMVILIPDKLGCITFIH